MGKYKDLNDYEVMYMIQENDEEAKDILFQKYRPIIVAFAKKNLETAKKYGLELDDLIQEGYLGLYGAIKNYKTEEGTTFYTYANVSIRSKILNCVLRKSIEKRNILSPLSLSETISTENDISLMDVLEDKNALLPHLVIEENDLSNQIKEFMLSLEFPGSLIFELKLNGFAMNDIVCLLDLSYKTVSNNLYHMRKEFKTYLLGDCKKEF